MRSRLVALESNSAEGRLRDNGLQIGSFHRYDPQWLRGLDPKDLWDQENKVCDQSVFVENLPVQ